MIKQPVTIPVAFGTVGLTGCAAADGEIKAAKAAEEFSAVHLIYNVHLFN